MIRYVLKATPIVVFFSFFGFSFLRAQVFKKQKKKSNRKRERLLLFFATYSLWLAFFLLINNKLLETAGVALGVDTSLTDWKLNLVPLNTVRLFFKHATTTGIFLNIWGNILIAIPLGFLTPLLFRSLKRPLPLCLFYGSTFFLIETIQYFTGRSADIDDWLLNMLGIVIGYLLAKKQTLFPPNIYQR